MKAYFLLILFPFLFLLSLSYPTLFFLFYLLFLYLSHPLAFVFARVKDGKGKGHDVRAYFTCLLALTVPSRSLLMAAFIISLTAAIPYLSMSSLLTDFYLRTW